MLHATISADIIASSSLSAGEINYLTVWISEIFARLDDYQKAIGGEKIVLRLVLGDTIECFIPNPGDALRTSLILKSGIKSFRLDEPATYEYTGERKKLRRLFETYGARIAIGIGEMDMELLGKDMFKGSAINLSGRLISEQKTSNKERVTVKNTLFIGSVNGYHSVIFKPVLSLLDALFNKMTVRQSEIIYRKLIGFSEGEIAKQLEITQPTVNQHSTGAGWNSIDEALKLFSTFDFNTNFAS